MPLILRSVAPWRCVSKDEGLQRALRSSRNGFDRHARGAKCGQEKSRPEAAFSIPFRISRSLHQLRAAGADALVFGDDAEAARDFRVGLHEAAEITAEAVLVELVVG